MDTRFLESFVFVADHGSFAEAARRLDLTPAALAQRLRALERDVGTPLVTRSGRTVVPTEAGRRVLARARAFLQSARDLRAAALDDRAAGELLAGAVHTTMNGLVPDLLARLAESHPRVRVRMSPGSSGELYERVRLGELDAALVVKPELALPKSLEWRTVRDEPLVLIAPAALKGRDPLALLRREPLIRLSRDTAGGRLVDRYLRRKGIAPQERFEITSLPAIAKMVDRGLGIALVPDWSPPWPEGLALRRITVPAPEAVRRIGVVFPRVSVRAGPVRAFVEAAAAVAEGLGRS